jgi:ATP-dependent DNA helicase RecG
MLTLATSVSKIVGVGPKFAQKLSHLGIERVEDLLFYFPRRHDDLSRPSKISDLYAGGQAIIRAKIVTIENQRSPRRWMALTKAILQDESGEIGALWFNQPFLIKNLRLGQEWIFFGKIAFDFRTKQLVLQSPSYEREAVILPVYSETEGLTSKNLRRIIKPLLNAVGQIEEFLPNEILKKENLLDVHLAIKQIHFPDNSKMLNSARQRLAFEELFLLSLKVLSNRKELEQNNAPKIEIEIPLIKKFVASLPFKLTDDQRKAAWEIVRDLSGRSKLKVKSKKLKQQIKQETVAPMNRLLEGEVGSGKTVVAAMAVLAIKNAGYQSVWMAPTEILALQHYKNVKKLLSPFGVKIGLLTSSFKKSEIQKVTDNDLIIGTHAVIQEDVHFPHLALIIVDEQHRFGVKQRAALKQRTMISESASAEASADKQRSVPHFLSMTATPIPRTLALSFYGDLDLSIIKQLPIGRQKIETKIISPDDRAKAYLFIKDQIKAGRQAFVICPLIGQDETTAGGRLFDLQEKKAAVAEYEKLSKIIFPDLRIGLLHGRMKAKDKEKAMTDFKDDKIDILVSTAVVEVGVDIPNASVMMIEGAEKFGLAQLHQFRGRVGRSTHKSYCFLFTESWSKNTQKRLQAMVESNDGFSLAEKDLQIRGPGELYGTLQSGMPDLKMASLSDIILMKRARASAEEIIAKLDQYPALLEKLKEFQSERHLE